MAPKKSWWSRLSTPIELRPPWSKSRSENKSGAQNDKGAAAEGTQKTSTAGKKPTIPPETQTPEPGSQQPQHRPVSGVSGANVSAALAKEYREEAEREASSIRLRSRRAAEVESARIIAEAKQESQRIMSEAHKWAEEATEQEVANIIHSAQDKASIIEDRARQIAQLFLMRAREDIRDYVTGEAKQGYYQLITALQELAKTALDVENEWKSRTVRLWDNANFQLETYHAALLDSIDADQSAEELGGKQPAFTSEQEDALTTEEVEVTGEVTPDAGGVTLGARETGSDARGTTSMEAGSESRESGQSAMGQAAKEPEQKEPEEAGEKGTADEVPLSVYRGDVELAVAPYADVAQLAQLHSHLQTVKGLRLVHTTGTWERGTTIRIALEQSTALQDLFPSIPGLVATPAQLRKTTGQFDGSASQPARIAVKMSGAEKPIASGA